MFTKKLKKLATLALIFSISCTTQTAFAALKWTLPPESSTSSLELSELPPGLEPELPPLPPLSPPSDGEGGVFAPPAAAATLPVPAPRPSPRRPLVRTSQVPPFSPPDTLSESSLEPAKIQPAPLPSPDSGLMKEEFIRSAASPLPEIWNILPLLPLFILLLSFFGSTPKPSGIVHSIGRRKR